MDEVEKFKSLVKYCSEGDIYEVENLLTKEKIDLGHEYFTGKFDILQLAVKNYDIDMVKILLENGAQVNVELKTPLKIDEAKKLKAFAKFCSEGNIQEVKNLLSSGEIDMDHEYFKHKFNPLYFAVKSDNVEMVKVLISHGAKLNIGVKPLLQMDEHQKLRSFAKFCQKGNIGDVEKMLSSGKIDLQSGYFTSVFNPLYCALYNDDIEMVKILLKYGAKANTESPLHEACNNGNYEIAEILVNCGADVNHYRPFYDERPLDNAVFYKHVSIVKLLLERGANGKGLTSNWQFLGIIDDKALDILKLLLDRQMIQSYILDKLLQHAIVIGQLPLLKFLIDEGINLNSFINSKGTVYEGLTPLCGACVHLFNRNPEMVEMMLKSGADPNLQSKGLIPGMTPLMMTRHVSVMETLLKFGADINIQDPKGNTALHLCGYYYRNDEVQKSQLTFLISRGINIDARNSDNKTAEEIFKEKSGYVEVLKHYQRSVEEISKLKRILLNNYGLSLYDILLISSHDLSRYVNNVNLRTIFEDLEFFEKFPILGTRLKEKFEQGKERRKLINLASQQLEYLVGLRFPELHLMIFKYFSDGEIRSKFLASVKQ